MVEWYNDRDKIDMDPSYQRRGNLWPDRNRKLLINSILNQYDIPKIYLADFTYIDTPLNEKRRPYAVIDGKQRLGIFFDFLEDKLALDETPIYIEDRKYGLKGCHYSDVASKHPTIVHKFDQFRPTVMSVISDKLDEIQELFIRLNQNVSISGPEKRNAMPGPLPRLIRDLSVHKFFRNWAGFPINRGQDLNVAGKILLMEERGCLTNTKKADLDRFVSSNKEESLSKFTPYFEEAKQTLGRFTQVFQQNDPLLKKSTQLSLYYWLVKNYKETNEILLRNLLEQFEQDREVARKQSNQRSEGEDVEIDNPDLLDYNRLLRSPDDKKKQETMYGILTKRLEEALS